MLASEPLQAVRYVSEESHPVENGRFPSVNLVPLMTVAALEAPSPPWACGDPEAE
jgi:hypothetical protein